MQQHRLRWIGYLCLLAVALAATGIPLMAACIQAGPPPPTGGPRVSGTKLLDAAGNTLVLRGVNQQGSEYACAGGYGFFDHSTNYNSMDADIPIMKSNWHFNQLVIGLNEECWLGINGAPAAYSGQNYINTMVHEVATVEANGMTPVISLIASAHGAGLPNANGAPIQEPMPNNDHTPTFWQSVANTFKGDPKVILRLKEEDWPGGNVNTVAAWTCLTNGDVQYNTNNTLVPSSTTANCSEAFTTVGLQSLVNIIRGTGATNVIQAGGVQFGGRLTHYLDAGIRLTDSLATAQIMAFAEGYPDSNGCGSGCYQSEYGAVAAVMPLVLGEVGPQAPNPANPNYADTASLAILTWMDGLSPPSGYSAWAWFSGGNANFVANYSTGACAAPWGCDYQAHVTALQ